MWVMAFSDYFIQQAIETLISEKPSEPLTYECIVSRCTVPVCTKTVQRSVVRMEAAGKLRRFGGGHGVGYRYELVS